MLFRSTLQLARMEQANEERVPFTLVTRLSGGESPVRVWREHRAMTGRKLAAAAGITPKRLADIEAGEEAPLRTMQLIARALDVDLDNLVPWSQE